MRLFDFILDNMESILLEWEKFARDEQPADGHMDVTALRDHAEEILRVIAADMQVPQTALEQVEKSKGEKTQTTQDTAAEVHGVDRLEAGFSISLLTSEYRALRASVLKLWSRQGLNLTEGTIEDIVRFNEAIDEALAESVERYSHALTMQQDVFVGILGHDLRTPLQSLSHGAHFLMHGKDLPGERIVELGARMSRSVRRMTGMIDNLLDFTKSRVGGGISLAPQETQLSAVAQQVVDEIQSYNPDRNFLFTVQGNCIGNWDPGRLAQIYQNLIGNALQYGTSDTPITVSAEDLQNDVVIKVKNFGTPIDKAEQRKLFDLFHRHASATKAGRLNQNLGLGLYIVREIAVAHGGSVSVTSSEENGTEFIVRLPKTTA